MSDKGRITLPVDSGMDDAIKEIIKSWGADAIRNCDGTELSDSLIMLGHKVYATYKLCRIDQDWAESHRDQLQQVYLMSERASVGEGKLVIDLLKGYFNRQLEINFEDDPKEWWEVINRTTGEVVNPFEWEYNREEGSVTLLKPVPWHEYTVNFLARVIWDPVHMYNHLTNEWTTPEQRPYDVRHPETRKHVLAYLENWLQKNREIDVVRFTTFFYNFTLIFNDKAKEKYVDWFGYSASVSPEAIREFEKEYGYRLRPEDFIDAGYHNSSFRVPSKEFNDWLEFQERFVNGVVKECVDLCHKYNKEAMMFLGDHWIGTEPYGNEFKNTGMDAVVGSVGSGATMRMISDIPGVKYTEGRFLPYFFPDNFSPGCNPTIEAVENWVQARRAMFRSPLSRMGYGGYLGLANQFPDFMEKVSGICEEFRTIHEKMDGTKAYTAPFKIAVLNAWGERRRWMSNMVAHAKWYREIYSYIGVIECLSGMAFDVSFLSFDEVKEGGIPEDVGIIINAGDAHTAWSGGEHWNDPSVTAEVRRWVHNGGGFVGIGEPSAWEKGGQYFQLSDVLGVDKELGFTLGYTKYDREESEDHFILGDNLGEIDFGESKKYIRQVKEGVKTLVIDQMDTLLSVNEYGKGRAVYLTGLPYSPENCRLLRRVLYWAAGKEKAFYNWHSQDIRTECAAFTESGWLAVINNSGDTVSTKVYRDADNSFKVELAPRELKWFNLKEDGVFHG